MAGQYLANALRRRIARQEADGDTDGVKATKKRLAAVEKAEAARAAPEPESTPASVESKTTAKEK